MIFEESETTGLVHPVQIREYVQADAHEAARESLATAERGYIREAISPNRNREAMRRAYLVHESASRKLNTLNFLAGYWSRRCRAAPAEHPPA